MDVLTEDPTFPQIYDQDLNIDGDSLNITLDDLEKFISEDGCLPDEAISAIAYNHPHNSHNGFRIRGMGSQLAPHHSSMNAGQHNPSTSMYCSQQQAQQQHHQAINTSMGYMDSQKMLQTTLPDSPPDSEPYSPPDGHPSTHQTNIPNGHQQNVPNGHPANMQNGHPANMANGHPSSLQNGTQNTHSDNTKYTLTSTPSSMHSHMYTPHHRPTGMSGPKPVVTIPPGYHEPPMLNHLPNPSHQPQIPPVSMPLNVSQNVGMNPQILAPGNLSPQSKKRKHMDPSINMSSAIYTGRNSMVPNIKQEPTGYTNSSYLPDCDDDYSSYDHDSSAGGYDNCVYQVIKWQDYQRTKWATLTDANLKDLPTPQYRVDADKGFNFSVSDEAFVCQKKNHFQVTCHINICGDPKYVRTSEGIKKIDQFYLHFHGVKVESPSQTIKIEQSQSDRSKKPFRPVRLDLIPNQHSKMTVGRLHFSETTSNNMRKKGRPNPDQRYFMLVVSLHAHSGENDYMIAANVSERIIVRASNPGQFDSDIEAQHWQKGSTPESVFHIGRVGVNTDHPDEALTVNGNIKLSGQVLHTSDVRAKEEFEEIDSKEQLKKVAGIKIYNYKYTDEYAEHVGLPPSRRKDTGVIAQEVIEVLPDAVLETGDVKFENGNEIGNLLVVNKDRIFMENVGAVKELCKLTDNLEVRIDELEKMNSKLSKLKRFDSLKSTVSSKSTSSNSTVSSPSKKPHRHRHPKPTPTPPPTPPSNHSWCSNRFIQITIIILICIMAFCLIAITILYILEKNSNSDKSSSQTTVINNHYPPGHSNSSGPSHASSSPPGTSRTPVTTVRTSTTTWQTTTVTEHEGTTTPVPPIPANCAPSQCSTKCCSTQDDGPSGMEGFEKFAAEIIGRKRHHDKPTIRILTPTPPPAQSTPKIEVVVNSGGQFSDNYSGKVNPQYSIGGPYRKKRSTDENAEFTAEITLVEVNFTVTDKYKNDRMSEANNITYILPFSPYFDVESYTLHFGVEEDHEVHLCYTELEEACSPSNTAESNWTDPEIAFQWRVPFAKYKETFLRFRVTREGNSNICHRPGGEEARGHYTEYSLFFERSCS